MSLMIYLICPRALTTPMLRSHRVVACRYPRQISGNKRRSSQKQCRTTTLSSSPKPCQPHHQPQQLILTLTRIYQRPITHTLLQTQHKTYTSHLYHPYPCLIYSRCLKQALYTPKPTRTHVLCLLGQRERQQPKRYNKSLKLLRN